MSDGLHEPDAWRSLTPRRWGIVGAGRIADSFADAMAVAPGQVVAATARDTSRVADFAGRHDIPHAFTSVDDLLACDDVDAVYVATPHSVHHQPVGAALGSGRPVLCEKPLTHSLAATTACVDAAREHGQFLMEAMWTRFLPAMATARSWIDAGDIGELRTLRAGMGFTAPADPASRLMAPALAGGALLDIGVYPLALARWAWPRAIVDDMVMTWEPTTTGVDGQLTVGMRFDGGGMADLAASLVSAVDGTAWLAGTEGAIAIPTFHKAQDVRLVKDHEVVRQVHHPHPVNGLEFQIAAMTAALADGLVEHPLMPWTDSLTVAGWSQQIRDRMGLRFPFEDAARDPVGQDDMP